MPAEYFARGPPRALREETLRNIRRAPRRDDSTVVLLRQRQNAPLRGAPRPEQSRRTQESRSRAARERLLSATIEVLIERGYNGLTTKEVSGRAGLSNGALVHHYGTKAELVIAATEQVYDRCIENGEKIANSDKARKHPLQAYIDDCLHVYLGWPFLAAVQVLVPARTDQTLMVQVDKFMQHYRHTMNDVWLAAFQRAGINRNDAAFLMMATLNMIRGMGINSLWQKNMPHYKKLLREWAAVAQSGAFDGRHTELR
jgi:AcrR family transcriptional regulator